MMGSTLACTSRQSTTYVSAKIKSTTVATAKSVMRPTSWCSFAMGSDIGRPNRRIA
jgi:hypothetical protein